MIESALILTVAAVIEREDGRMLLVRKRGSAILIQPGGKREAGEPSLDTLRRELQEELGVDLDADGVQRLGEFEDVAVHECGRRVRAEAFIVRVRGVPAPCAEIEELVWIAPRPPFDPAVAPLSANHILPAFARWRGRR